MDPDERLQTPQSPNRSDPGFWDEELVREYGPTPTLRTIMQCYKKRTPAISLQTRAEVKRSRAQHEQEKKDERKQEREEHQRQRKFWIREGIKIKNARMELEIQVLKNQVAQMKKRLPKKSMMVLKLGMVKKAELEQIAYSMGLEPTECLLALIDDAIRRLPR
jgi:hypothetical protein